MAWRISGLLIEGVLDNSENGKVTGWMKFAGMDELVRFDLDGNFHRDIRGARVRLRGDGESANVSAAKDYLQGFVTIQKGNVGDMTCGREPADYVTYPYFEWYGQENGRCVIELDESQVELMTQPVPAMESDPISRKEQAENMAEFMLGVAKDMKMSSEMVFSVGHSDLVEHARKVVANNKVRGMKLLPEELRRELPGMAEQDGKGSKAIVYAKYFTPDGNWTWYVVSGESVRDENGCEVDFQFFGLVDGLEREFGYFNLSELESVKGPMGLPIERDLYFKAKPIGEIAPELFEGGDCNE